MSVGVGRLHPYPAPRRRTFFSSVRAPQISAIAVILIGCIFLQRLAVGVGEMQLSLSFLVGYGVLAYLLLRGRLAMSFPLAIMFMVVMAMLTLSMIRSGSTSSIMSFFYLFSIYGLYLFKMRGGQEAAAGIHDLFQRLMMAAAACGIAQFCLQFVLPLELIFPLETFVPSAFLFGSEFYNVVIPLTYGSDIYKSNGIFFLEPSFFSQFLAIAVILELLGRQRALRLALYAGGLLVAYSGTGLLLIALMLPYVLLRRGNLHILLFGLAGAVVLAFSATALNLDIMFARVGEFNSEGSSGFARFISPFYLFRDFIDTSSAFFFGHGPGSILGIMREASYKGYISHDPTWIKAVMEYGVIAGFLLIVYTGLAFIVGPASRPFAIAILVLFLFMGGYLLNPVMHFLFATLLAWPNSQMAASSEQTRGHSLTIARGNALRFGAPRTP